MLTLERAAARVTRTAAPRSRQPAPRVQRRRAFGSTLALRLSRDCPDDDVSAR